MEKLRKLRDELYDAETALSEKQDAIMEYLRPIIKNLKGIDKLAGGFHRLTDYRDSVELEVRWDGRGGPYDTSYTIPKSVLDAADAAEAAAELKRQQDREAEKLRKQGIRAQIAHLQSQL
jgi:hypothetical protein